MKNPNLKAIPKDRLYQIDVLLANRPDGGTVSDTLSEVTGLPKETVHTAMVGGAAVYGTVRIMRLAARHPIAVALTLAAIWGGAKLLRDYMDAPRV